MEEKYVIAIAVCVPAVVVIITVVVVVAAVLIRRRRRVVRRRAQETRPKSSVSVEGVQQVRAPNIYRISRDDIVERSGKDDLELKGVTVSPTGQEVSAVCPPTPPVGGVQPPHLPPI
ncbi:uncharacterized protein [Haliotis asinina]|uniref:uncharacterized protein n=1 Tax=Haliotis asinina TaxID=109174 RepID=UPI0035318598